MTRLEATITESSSLPHIQVWIYPAVATADAVFMLAPFRFRLQTHVSSTVATVQACARHCCQVAMSARNIRCSTQCFAAMHADMNSKLYRHDIVSMNVAL